MQAALGGSLVALRTCMHMRIADGDQKNEQNTAFMRFTTSG
jgi:hypothetical protein